MIGLINYYIGKMGFPPLLWFADIKLAMTTLIIISIWKNMGYNMVIFLAGLQAIPDIYYEASTIDGASPIKQFFSITLPLLRPTTLFVMIMSIMGSFQVFDQVYLMTSGGPVNRTKVIVFYIYETAFNFYEMGYATALSVILFIMTLFLSVAQFKLFPKDAYS
jgi:multiple sugar transport system permease protein